MADELYSRILGSHPNPMQFPKVAVDNFSAAAYLRANGTITEQQMQDIIASNSGAPLGVDGLLDLRELILTVSGSPAAQLQRIHTIEYVLHLADSLSPHFDT